MGMVRKEGKQAGTKEKTGPKPAEKRFHDGVLRMVEM
jgi:hypothetical protein